MMQPKGIVLPLALLVVVMVGSAVPAVSAEARPKAGAFVHGFGKKGTTLTGLSKTTVDGWYEDSDAGLDGSVTVLGNAGPGESIVLMRFDDEGQLDSEFGNGGIAARGLVRNGRILAASELAIQSDGRPVVGAHRYSETGGSFEGGVLARYDRRGRLDRTFGKQGTLNIGTPVGLMAVDSQDRLLVFGRRDCVATLARYLPDGRPDPKFGDDGAVDTGLSCGRGLSDMSLGGNRITLSSANRVIRFRKNGQSDPSFGDSGRIKVEANRTIRAIAVSADGGVLFLRDRSPLFKLKSDGTPDLSFGDSGQVRLPSGVTLDLAVDSTGRILSVGSYFDPNGSQDGFVRVMPDGQLDPTFGAGGLAGISPGPGLETSIWSVDTLSDGSILAGAPSWTPDRSAPDSFSVVKYLPNGHPDPGFGSAGGWAAATPVVSGDDEAKDSTYLSSGRILVVGKAESAAGMVRYRRDGRLDRRFGDNGRITRRFTDSTSGDAATSVAAMSDDGFVICSSSKGGATISRFQEDGSLFPGFAENGVYEVPQMLRCDKIVRDHAGRLLAAGVDSQGWPILIRLLSDGSPDSSLRPLEVILGAGSGLYGTTYFDLDLALAPNRDILLSASRFRGVVARFDEDGTLKRGFGEEGFVETGLSSGPNLKLRRLSAIDVGRRGRIFVGGSSGQRLAVGKLSARGKPIRRFGKEGTARFRVLTNGNLDGLKVQADGRIVAAGWARTGKCRYSDLACMDQMVVSRLTPRGRLDRSFGAGGNVVERVALKARAKSLLLGRRGITVAGYAETSPFKRQFMLLRLQR